MVLEIKPRTMFQIASCRHVCSRVSLRRCCVWMSIMRAANSAIRIVPPTVQEDHTKQSPAKKGTLLLVIMWIGSIYVPYTDSIQRQCRNLVIYGCVNARFSLLLCLIRSIVKILQVSRQGKRPISNQHSSHLNVCLGLHLLACRWSFNKQGHSLYIYSPKGPDELNDTLVYSFRPFPLLMDF